MRKLILISTIVLMITTNYVSADCGADCSQGYTEGKKQTKCIDLMTTMYNERATLYNVLNLSYDQQKCKDVIETKRYHELGEQFQKYEQEKYVLTRMSEHKASKQAINKQEKVVKNLEHCMQSINNKYDKEFKTILNSEQKSKLKTIRKMEKQTIKYCQKNKAFYKPDPNLRPFGEKTLDTERLCPKHKKWHLFGYKHKTK